MAKYQKLIVAVLGAILVALNELFGIEIGLQAQEILAFAVPILTAVGVWRIPNAT